MSSWQLDLCPLMIYQHILLTAEVFNQSEHCQSSNKYLITEINERIYCLNNLRIIRTQITWGQGFHNLHRKLVNFYNKERIYWYTKRKTHTYRSQPMFLLLSNWRCPFSATIRWNSKNLKSQIAFKERKSRIHVRKFIEIQMTNETCL